MKKFLLALFFVAGAIAANAQKDLWFNEMFTTPVKSNSEFIEMYNTSNTDIFLDCYIIVSYVAPGEATGFGSQGGAYVYNFPTNSKISALSYYLLASNSSLTFKASGQGGSKTITPSDPTKFSNWSQTITGGYITKYNYDGTTWTANSTGTDLQNIMPKDGALLLYKINSDGTTTLVNGVFGGNLPSAVPNLNDLTGLPSSSSCYTGNVTLKFKNQGISATTVDIASVAASTGQDHGYAKIGNGLCGSWAKTQTFSEFTPGSKNPTSLGTVTPTLTTTQAIICGNRIDFTIPAPTSPAQTGITALLYIDVDKDGILDGSIDTYVATYPTTLTSGTNTVYSFTNIPALQTGQQYLVVYRTSLGCFDQADAPAAGVLNVASTYRNVCGKQVDFEITDISADLLNSGVPITANVYADLAPVGTLGANDVLIGSQQFSSKGATTYSVNIPTSPTDYSGTPMLIQFTSSTACYTSSALAVPGLTPVTTALSYSCNTISVTVTPPNADAAKYSTTLTADIYLDKNNIGQLGPNDKPITTLSFTSLTANTPSTLSYTIPDKSLQGKSILVVYSVPALSSCITPAAQTAPYSPNASNGPINAIGNFPADQNPSAPVSYVIQNTTNTLAYPITVLVYEDVNGNHKVDNADVALDAAKVINSAPAQPDNTVYTTTNSYPAQYNVIVHMLGTCVTADLEIAASAQAPLPVHFVTFNAVRKDDSKVALAWTTATEQNNKGFYVQRNDGNEWKDVALVFSQAQNGNSMQNLSYSFTDLNPSKGVSQYRILQVDLDGKGHYSETRSVRGSGAAAKLLLFPNPSNTGSVTLLFATESAKTVTVSDVTGRTVQQFKNAIGSSLQLKNLNNGFYTVQVSDAATGTIQVEKFIIKKR